MQFIFSLFVLGTWSSVVMHLWLMTCPVINYCTLFSHIRPFLSLPHSFGLISPCSTQISRQVAAHFLTTSFLGSSWIERAIRTSNICPSITFSAVSLSTDSRFFNTKQPRCWISIFSLTTVLSKISCHWLTCFKITNPSIKFLVTTAVVERERERRDVIVSCDWERKKFSRCSLRLYLQDFLADLFVVCHHGQSPRGSSDH